jgi:hypothetical protein
MVFAELQNSLLSRLPGLQCLSLDLDGAPFADGAAASLGAALANSCAPLQTVRIDTGASTPLTPSEAACVARGIAQLPALSRFSWQNLIPDLESDGQGIENNDAIFSELTEQLDSAPALRQLELDLNGPVLAVS